MPLTFRQGNDNLDLGWTTNGSCVLTSLILDSREPKDPGTGEAWYLMYLPIALIVQPPDADVEKYGHICDDVPEGCYPIRPSVESSQLKFPKSLKLPAGAPKHIHIRRRGFKVVPSEAATSYFHQGATHPFPIPIVIDMRIPPGLIAAAMPYVAMGRAQSIQQLHLLQPLWKRGDQAAKRRYLDQARKTFAYDADTKQFQIELKKRAAKTLERTDLTTLHYFTAENPNVCATCGALIGQLG